MAKQSDRGILFRSYNHMARVLPNHGSPASEMNPRTLENSRLLIHEACSATSAAPTYFRAVVLLGRKYIDGAVQNNNPSSIAWIEAKQMANPPAGRRPADHVDRLPAALVSIGTGMSAQHSRLKGLTSFLCYMARNVTETERTHATVGGYATDYFRFNVPDNMPHDPRHRGLDKIQLVECKKKHKVPWQARVANRLSGQRKAEPAAPDAPQTNGGPAPTGNDHPAGHGHAGAGGRRAAQILPTQTGVARNAVQRARAADHALQRAAAETHKGGYKPHKYHYTTFDKIRDRTIIYCNGAQDSIADCARVLRNASLQRRNLERASRQAGRPVTRSWDDFRRHSHPHAARADTKPPASSNRA